MTLSPIKCSHCRKPTDMTCRDSQGNLYNCCRECKEEHNLLVSVVWEQEEEDESLIHKA